MFLLDHFFPHCLEDITNHCKVQEEEILAPSIYKNAIKDLMFSEKFEKGLWKNRERFYSNTLSKKLLDPNNSVPILIL